MQISSESLSSISNRRSLADFESLLTALKSDGEIIVDRDSRINRLLKIIHEYEAREPSEEVPKPKKWWRFW